jgi:hypothetical protein
MPEMSLAFPTLSVLVQFKPPWRPPEALLLERRCLFLVTALTPDSVLIPLVAGTSLVFLTALGGLAARAGGAGMAAGAIRVTFWGALAMGVTAGVGALFRTSS